MQRLHRFLLGLTDPKIIVDHEDRNGLNNQRGNLRVATKSQNEANSCKQHGTTSRFKGVSWNKRGGKWEAQIAHRHLGCFADEMSAALAYDTAARKHFGEFCNCNFPPKKPSEAVAQVDSVTGANEHL